MTAERFDFNLAEYPNSLRLAMHKFMRRNEKEPTRIGINLGTYRRMIHDYGHAAMRIVGNPEQMVIMGMLVDFDNDIAPNHIILVNDERAV